MDTPVFSTFDSPIGLLSIVAQESVITRVLFPSETPPADALPAQSFLLDTATTQLQEYFSRNRQRFNLPIASAGSSFTYRARRALTSIPFGAHWTYAQLADAAGSPRAVRAAGTACATNPLPILVPCHRVIRADGTVGNYRGGAKAKHWLLDFESSVTTTTYREL